MQPHALRGWLFDLDGVLTDTARAHADAWKQTFDALLERRWGRGEGGDGVLVPFDAVADYERYVDGRARSDGVRAFLGSRGIVVPEGRRDDPPEAETVQGIGQAKNALFLELIERGGVEVFPQSRLLVDALVRTGRCTGVVSASENCRAVLRAGGLGGLFYVVVDGLVALERGLAGKPAPDTFLYGAALLQLHPAEVAVVEDAPAGVTAGRAGGFGYVVGVARRAQANELLEAGADVVVGDLGEFAELFELLGRWA